MARTRIIILASFPICAAIGAACFDGSGLAGAPCLADEDCGPKLTCLASVCGEGEPMASEGRWPDSPTIYCSDGTAEVEPCPDEGSAGHGQDGNYRVNVPSYEEQDDIVHDSVTGLDWESRSTNGEMDQASAIERCENLQLGERQWRLPSRLELISLLDYGRNPPFPGVQTGAHWTASDTGDPQTGWTISFLDFTAVDQPDTDDAFVLCTSGPPLASSFSIDSDTIQDALTGFVWQREHHDSPTTWLEAIDYCEGLSLAGADDWRLPSAKELLTLIRDDQELVDGLDGDNETFWTSSPGYPADRAFTLEFPWGTTSMDQMIYPNYVRCVRG